MNPVAQAAIGIFGLVLVVGFLTWLAWILEDDR